MAAAAERIAIVSGKRTPFVKAGTAFRLLDPLDLSTHAVQALIDDSGLDPAQIATLVWGRVLHDPRTPNLAREIVFRLKLPSQIQAHLVSNNCISSLYSISQVADQLRQGVGEVGIAGGVESMSNPPILFGRQASRIFIDAGLARSAKERLRTLLKLRPRHFRPGGLGFAEPSTGLTMGEHAEITAKEWAISRSEQDHIALASHQNAAAATKDGRLKEQIAPLVGVGHDLIVRNDTSFDRLSKLRPVFDLSEEGTISAGNSSPLTDGAAAVLLMTESAARARGVTPLAFLKAVEYAAIDPRDGLLMAPAVAVPRLLKKTGLTLAQMDLVEIHEAFGAQVAFNLKAWEQGWKEDAIGRPDPERINVCGGSIAIGHPFGATGARIVMNLAMEMARRDVRYGLVSICAAGAMGGAIVLERT